MPWAAAAAVAAAGVGAAASNSAAKKQAGAAGNATQAQLDQYYQARQDQEPWRDAGQQALNQLVTGIGGTPYTQTQRNFDPAAYLAAHPNVSQDPRYAGDPYQHYLDYGRNLGYEFTSSSPQQTAAPTAGGIDSGEFNRKFTLADFQKDPGYDFRLNQGLDSVQGSRAARGSMLSGSTLKALSDYGSNYASSEYGKAYDRFNNDQTTRFNRLSSIAGIGQTATNNVGTAGANAANNISGNLIGAGNAAAAGQVGTANAINGGLSNLQSIYQLNQLNNRNAAPSWSTAGGGSGQWLDGAGGQDGTMYLP
jgi:hypothetical protein